MMFNPFTGLALAAILLALHPASANASVVLPGDFRPLEASSLSPAQTAINAGFAALHRDDLVAAEAAFKQASGLNPKLPAAYLGLAEVAGRRNNFVIGDSWLKKAMAADQHDFAALRVWAVQQYRRGLFAAAEVSFKKLIGIDPTSAEAQADLAENYLIGMKKPKLAEDAYRAAISRDPRNVRAHMGLAGALAAQGRADDAIGIYRQSTLIAPTDPRPAHSLARLYASQIKFDQALLEHAKAIAIDPGFTPAHIDRGDLLLAKNDIDGAIGAYRAGIQTTKKPAGLYFRLGVALQAAQRWSESEQAYLDAVKHEPLMFGAYNNLAFMAASRKERLDDALAWAKKAIQLSPKTTTLLDTLGWVHFARGELERAAAAIQVAVTSNPAQPNFRYHLGLVYTEQGKKRDAIASLQKALELDKNFRNAADAKARLEVLLATKQ